MGVQLFLGQSLVSLCILTGSFAECRASPSANAYRNVAIALRPLSQNPIVLSSSNGLLDTLTSLSAGDWQARQSEISDPMLKQRLLQEPAIYRFSELYNTVLNSAKWAAIPLNHKESADLGKVKKALFKNDGKTPLPAYQVYIDIKKRVDVIRSKIEETPGGDTDPLLQQELNGAEQDLALKGHAATYYPLEQRLSDFNQKISYSWLEPLRAKLAAEKQSAPDGKDYYRSPFSTPIDEVLDSDWQNVKIDGLQKAANTNSVIYGDTVSESTQWWNIPNDPPSSGKCQQDIAAGMTQMSFQATSVHVSRDWFDPALFESDAWKMPDGSTLISDGATENNKGASPNIAISVIIVRDVIISGDGIQPCLDQIRRAVERRETVRFGPFVIAGYTDQKRMYYAAPALGKKTIRAPFAQIIAYETSTLPFSPKPNPEYQW